LQKAVFYLYFGIGLDLEEVCETLDIINIPISEILAELYEKFGLELAEDNYGILLDKVEKISENITLEVEKLSSHEEAYVDILDSCNSFEIDARGIVEQFFCWISKNIPFLQTLHYIQIYLESEVRRKFRRLIKLLTLSLTDTYWFRKTRFGSSVLSMLFQRNSLKFQKNLFFLDVYSHDFDYSSFALKKSYTRYLTELLEDKYVPETINLEIVKPLFKSKYEVINFSDFKPMLCLDNIDRCKVTVSWFDWISQFLANNECYFTERFFATAQHQCLQMAVNWNVSAKLIWEQCCEKSIARLMLGETIENLDSWLRYVVFAEISSFKGTEEQNFLFLTDFCNHFRDYSVDGRSLLDEKVVEDVLKSLSIAGQRQSITISDWSSLWNYTRYMSACTLTSSEIDFLLDILFKALNDSHLNWTLSFVDHEILSRLSTVDKYLRRGSYRESWINLKAAVAKQQQLLDSFNHQNDEEKNFVRGYLSHEQNNRFSSCVDFLSFVDNVDDRKNSLSKSLTVLNRENLTFDEFKKLVSDISLDNFVDNKKPIFNDEKVNFIHDTKHGAKLSLSIGYWKGGQSIPKHHHRDKFDAIYVYRGTLKQIIYDDSDVSKQELILQGEKRFLDSMIVHELSNYSLSSNAISVHVQWYKTCLSEEGISEECPNSANTFVKLY
jgi:hypothetical protein